MKRLLHSGLTLVCVVWLSLSLLASASGEEQHTSGSSAKSLRKQTVSSLPLAELNTQTREKIKAVVTRPSFYRRLPVTSIAADPDHFRFLVRYPEVVVSIWQLMGVTQMDTERTAPYTIKSNDGAGTISSIELVYGTENLHVFYGTGTYEGPILKRKLNGKCVLVLRTENQLGRDGEATQTCQLDVFLKIDNATAGLIAKTIQPIVGTTADHNFVESLKFIQRLDQTTQKNGPGVEQMSRRLDIDPVVRERYAVVIDKVFQRAINASTPTGTANIRPTSLRSQKPAVPQPAPTLEPSNFLNPNYQQQSGAPGFQNTPTAIPHAPRTEYSKSAAHWPNQPQSIPGASIHLGDNRSSVLGSQVPAYQLPNANVYPAYNYPPSSAGQIRQQAYSEFEYGGPYNAAHAYGHFSSPGFGPVQATYRHFEN